MSHKGHVTVAAHHMRKVSQWQLVGQKTRTLMSCHCRQGSLRNRNTQRFCCVKKLRMTQAQSFRAHTPGGFKFVTCMRYIQLTIEGIEIPTSHAHRFQSDWTHVNSNPKPKEYYDRVNSKSWPSMNQSNDVASWSSSWFVLSQSNQ